ncbi:MAG: ATP-binding cassette domain-containing protein [Candidatus Omnitrophica bacterium]|nr:ATP-binding cassette domain-containing protein [Candidatus Omnitrophota bacterium]MBU1047847.1 ATP-binding cassette domain-containing protein [Candidatus Omnitrophota bacterium]MBU1630509.1 ATP-binding cassette domain-containing protein [Candidatus Omnitrophota bacterium]MBU1767436.1 ATP-binding cassette domain-containing protein [Candidatus Omnitrophota bacterium]MBU1888469.1 ATP-binding cassette domain-containing protein [Candidatus Omnitrophota bacterium]
MRTLLQLKNIHKAYGLQVIFNDVSFTIAENQKIGVIGRNGSGKSTLCKIITGHEEQDSGTVQKSAIFRLAYLEQHDPYKLDETVVDFLMRYTGKEPWQCGKIAARFKITNEMLSETIGVLSGGFRTRVKLVSMLLRDPNLLILDEPTNYLDLRTLILLEEFLRDFRGGFLIVSHDREFLIRTCKETLEIENGSCTLYPRDVEEYLLYKEEQRRLKECYNKKITAKKKQLQTFIDRFGAKNTKASQAQSFKKKMAKMKTIDVGHQLDNVHIKIPNVETSNLMAFSCDELAIGYPDYQVASSINMQFKRGAHIAILGDNGQGKTTFMRTIADDLETKSGSYKWGHNLKIGYYAQHVLLSLNPKDDVYTHLSNKAQNFASHQAILNLAGSFLFKGDDVQKKVSVLSGGEKARLCLAGLLLSKSDVLLLDEPTNHLDFETAESLGKALKKFHGTIMFISHDRTFVNMLATEIVEVKDGAILSYPGNYEDYVYRIETRFHNELSAEKTIKQKPKSVKTHNKPDRKILKRLKLEIGKLNSRIKEIQTRFEGHKKEWEEIRDIFMNDSSSWSVERSLRYEYLGKVIKEEEDLWLELLEKAEEINKKIDNFTN